MEFQNMREADDIQRIRSDLAKAKARVEQIRSGAMGARSGNSWDTANTTKYSLPNGAVAWENQLRAREKDVERLELEYVNAMLPRWGARRVIDAIEHFARCKADDTGPSAPADSGARIGSDTQPVEA